MSEYNLQVNVTMGDYLFNLNGQSAEELDEHVAELAKRSGEIFNNLTAIRQAGMAAAVFSDNETRKTTPAVPVTTGEGPPPAGQVTCPHGVMSDLVGRRNAKGDLYKYRYYCAAKRDDPTKCKEGKVEQK